VVYDASAFLLKNRDALNPDVVTTFGASRNPLVAELFKAPEEPLTSKSGKMTLRTLKKAQHQTSVAGQFQVRRRASTSVAAAWHKARRAWPDPGDSPAFLSSWSTTNPPGIAGAAAGDAGAEPPALYPLHQAERRQAGVQL